jgi:hypothetical protein
MELLVEPLEVADPDRRADAFAGDDDERADLVEEPEAAELPTWREDG